MQKQQDSRGDRASMLLLTGRRAQEDYLDGTRSRAEGDNRSATNKG
jgi:hypothetical protein